MPRFGHYSMYILCNDRRLAEHDIRFEGRTVTCWVESKVGETFVLTLKNGRRSVDVDVRISIDGARVKRKTVRRDHETTCDGVRADKDSIKPFMFANLELSDDDALLHTLGSQLTESIGSIVLTVYEVEVDVNPPEYDGSFVEDRSGDLPNKPIHERAKKMGGHRVGLSENVLKRPYRLAPRTRPLNPQQPGPVATFVFKYRSRDLLIAHGIVNADPQGNKSSQSRSTGKNPMKRPRSSANLEATPRKDGDDEVRQLEAQHTQISQRLDEARKRQRTAVPVKRERDGVGGSQSVKSSSVLIGEREVIDLTLD